MKGLSGKLYIEILNKNDIKFFYFDFIQYSISNYSFTVQYYFTSFFGSDDPFYIYL